VEGLLSSTECVQSAQRYQIRVGDAFALIGSETGFLHDRIVDPADPVSGACMDDPTASPLLVGRVPLTAPPCVGDGITDLTPNPCSTTVEQVEPYTEWDTTEGMCKVKLDANNEEIRYPARPRQADAIRLRNPVFTFHLVDPETTGDAQCNGDRLGTDPPHPTASPGYRVTFRVVGGYFAGSLAMQPSNGTRRLSYPRTIERGPYGDMWILDQGDRSASIRGQVLWFRPEAPTDLSTQNYLQ
jgi:hypothetical protein